MSASSLRRSARRFVRENVDRLLNLARKQSVGVAVLAVPPLRAAFNELYETVGPTRIGDMCRVAIDESAVRHPFVWRSRVLGKPLLMPVDPEIARGSWHSALNWSWSGHAPMRKFYEYALRRRRPRVFFDVGANYGTHTYPLALHGVRCVCFEPQAVCGIFIERVAALNQVTEFIETVPVALSDVDGGTVQLFTSESTWVSSLIREMTERFESARPVDVPRTTLDRYVTDRGIAPDLLKIDVEGWEGPVIAGALDTIRDVRPTVLIELLHISDSAKTIYRTFNELGYSTVALEPRGPRALSSFDELRSADSENFALFQSADEANAFLKS